MSVSLTFYQTMQQRQGLRNTFRSKASFMYLLGNQQVIPTTTDFFPTPTPAVVPEEVLLLEVCFVLKLSVKLTKTLIGKQI